MKSIKMLSLTMLALAMAGLQAKTPMEIDFKLAAEKRFQLDGIIPLSADAYWPGAQYLATVTTLPATLKFVTIKAVLPGANCAAWPGKPSFSGVFTCFRWSKWEKL